METDKLCADAGGSAATHWRPYSVAEIEAAQASTSGRSSPLPSGLSNTFTNFVTQTYARSSPATFAPVTSGYVGLDSSRAVQHLFGKMTQHTGHTVQ